MLLEISFKLFQVFIEHVLPAEFSPSSEVVHFGLRLESVFFENPVNLLFFAPHNIPIIAIDFLPLSVGDRFVHTVPEGSFELDVRSG